ncbi:ABC transporter ATP-binding protein [Candidatus Acetothermia bacterium]|nr:ABC transporter ATP-binding protein [Candidatus Acetothermia bacterium]MBI3660763.1 ABC transporter ATP-binding protein [Candidatus Acetothermia bacterium]
MLSIENIDTFYGQSHVLHGLSLEVKPGEIVSLLGRNGSGKTTTMRSVTGMTPPRAGQIFYLGGKISGWPPHQIFRAGAHLVPQGRRIFPQLTVIENLKLAMFQSGVRDERAALQETYKLFSRLEERKNFKAGHLSGGERQMLAIARALLGKPQLILFDEPSEGLAPMVVKEIRDIIVQLGQQGVSILLAEQNVKMALTAATRHYVIDKGQVRFTGTTAEIEQNEEVESYLGVSTRR